MFRIFRLSALALMVAFIIPIFAFAGLVSGDLPASKKIPSQKFYIRDKTGKIIDNSPIIKGIQEESTIPKGKEDNNKGVKKDTTKDKEDNKKKESNNQSIPKCKNSSGIPLQWVRITVDAKKKGALPKEDKNWMSGCVSRSKYRCSRESKYIIKAAYTITGGATKKCKAICEGTDIKSQLKKCAQNTKQTNSKIGNNGIKARLADDKKKRESEAQKNISLQKENKKLLAKMKTLGIKPKRQALGSKIKTPKERNKEYKTALLKAKYVREIQYAQIQKKKPITPVLASSFPQVRSAHLVKKVPQQKAQRAGMPLPVKRYTPPKPQKSYWDRFTGIFGGGKKAPEKGSLELPGARANRERLEAAKRSYSHTKRVTQAKRPTAVRVSRAPVYATEIAGTEWDF